MSTATLVREMMTIGVPVCRDTEACGTVAARLERQGTEAEAVVVLDDDGMACGWVAASHLTAVDPATPVGAVMDEDIPAIGPEATLEAAAQLMQARGVSHLFLMHDWPGERRPSAYISLEAIARLAPQEDFHDG